MDWNSPTWTGMEFLFFVSLNKAGKVSWKVSSCVTLTKVASYFSLCSVFYSVSWQLCTYALARFKHKTTWSGFRKDHVYTPSIKWRCPDFSLNISSFCHHKHGWKLSSFSCQLPTFQSVDWTKTSITLELNDLSLISYLINTFKTCFAHKCQKCLSSSFSFERICYVSFDSCDSEINIFEFWIVGWTKQDILRRNKG